MLFTGFLTVLPAVNLSGLQWSKSAHTGIIRRPTAFSVTADTALTIPVILSVFEAQRTTVAIAVLPRKRMIAGWKDI
jgi:hypothetical protein